MLGGDHVWLANREGARRERAYARCIATAAAVSLALALAILGFATQALAAEAGTIAGTVTSASSHDPIPGIEACAYGPGDEESAEETCVTTSASGEYTLAGLAAGAYVVEFTVPFNSTLDYVTQYYEGKAGYAEATPVNVVAGATASDIDAQLVEGGRITGRVTSATTGTPIEGALVCALPTGNTAPGCAITNTGGEYALSSLASGEYKVAFAYPRLYEPQYYNGKPSLASAEPVPVTAGATTSGIDAALAPAPSSTLPTPTMPPGSPGVEPQRSAPPPAASLTPVLTIGRGRIVISAGLAGVRVRCASAPCEGSIELTVQVSSKRRNAKHSHTEVIVLAKGAFSLSPGRVETSVLHVTSSGRRWLASRGRGRLPASRSFAAMLLAEVSRGRPASRTVRAS